MRCRMGCPPSILVKSLSGLPHLPMSFAAWSPSAVARALAAALAVAAFCVFVGAAGVGLELGVSKLLNTIRIRTTTTAITTKHPANILTGWLVKRCPHLGHVLALSATSFPHWHFRIAVSPCHNLTPAEYRLHLS